MSANTETPNRNSSLLTQEQIASLNSIGDQIRDSQDGGEEMSIAFKSLWNQIDSHIYRARKKHSADIDIVQNEIIPQIITILKSSLPSESIQQAINTVLDTWYSAAELESRDLHKGPRDYQLRGLRHSLSNAESPLIWAGFHSRDSVVERIIARFRTGVSSKERIASAEDSMHYEVLKAANQIFSTDAKKVFAKIVENYQLALLAAHEKSDPETANQALITAKNDLHSLFSLHMLDISENDLNMVINAIKYEAKIAISHKPHWASPNL